MNSFLTRSLVEENILIPDFVSGMRSTGVLEQGIWKRENR